MTETFVQARYLTSKGEMLVLTDYEVSNLGRVRKKKTGRILSVNHTTRGYYVQTFNKGKSTCYIGRLVLSSFTDKKDCNLDVIQKDGDKSNNCLTNLEWRTHLENMNCGIRNELIAKSHSKPVLQYDKSGAFIQEWSSASEVKKHLGIAQSCICECCNGKRKSAGGFVWRFK